MRPRRDPSACPGASALAVDPFIVCRLQSPFGSDTVPGRTVGAIDARQRTSPRPLKTRTVSPSSIRRGRASSGWMTSAAGCFTSSASDEEIVFSLDGDSRASGYAAVPGSGW